MRGARHKGEDDTAGELRAGLFLGPQVRCLMVPKEGFHVSHSWDFMNTGGCFKEV